MSLMIEVTNIESKGFWILIDGRELYLDYLTFPWFLDASVKQIINLKRELSQHLYWPELDIDLTLEMIETPERFPLKAQCVEQVAEENTEYSMWFKFPQPVVEKGDLFSCFISKVTGE